MMNIKTSTILVLAAASLVTAACDPFPDAPGGSPAVLRAVASGPSSETIVDPVVDPNAIVIDDAVLNDTFYVWFNKEMDGSTIQALPDTNPATGLPNADPCNVAGSPLTATLPADAELCYASGSAQGGGMVQINPASFWDVGAYVVGGTVRDNRGAPLTFQATFNVTHRPVLIEPDPYTIDLGWANDPTATGFTIQRQITDGSDPVAANWVNVVTGTQWAEPGSTVPANNSIFRVTGLTPGAIYWFRVLPEGAAAPAASTPAAIEMAGPPAVVARANPVIGTGPAANTAQLSTAGIRGAEYRVEQTTDVASETPAWTTSPGPITSAAGAALTNPFTLATRPLVVNVAGLTNGTSYRFRFVPIFGGVAGTPTAASGAVTVTNP